MTHLTAEPEQRDGQIGIVISVGTEQVWTPAEWILEQARQIKYAQADAAYEAAHPARGGE